MTPIAPLITDFLRNYLPVERGYSPHTCDSYAYAFRLLFLFAAERLGSRPSQLHLEHLDAPLIVAFLTHFEVDRGGSPASRNVRLAAVKAFMRYIEFRHPAALDQARQILAIPSKRHAQPLVRHLTMDEIDRTTGMVLSKPSRFLDGIPRDILTPVMLMEDDDEDDAWRARRKRSW